MEFLNALNLVYRNLLGFVLDLDMELMVFVIFRRNFAGFRSKSLRLMEF
jgi:hypothetical protein